MAGNLKITLTRSPIGRAEKHKKVVRGLGLTKTGRSVIRKDTPEIRGMIDKVSYLLTVEAE